MTYFCLLHANQIPICGFASKESALEYRRDHLTLDGWTVHYFDGHNYAEVN